MERRNFVKQSSIALGGISVIPEQYLTRLLKNDYILPPPLFAIAAWRYFKTAFEIISIAHTAYSVYNDFFKQKNFQSECKTITRDGYKIYEYSKLESSLPSMPSKYATFAKINPRGSTENIQVFFGGSTHERKEIKAILPESILFAICCAIRDIKNSGTFDLDNSENDRVMFKSLFFPVGSKGEYISEDFNSITYSTLNGYIKFVGKLIKDVEHKPIQIDGQLEIFPYLEQDGKSVVKIVDYNKESLEFLYT